MQYIQMDLRDNWCCVRQTGVFKISLYRNIIVDHKNMTMKIYLKRVSS